MKISIITVTFNSEETIADCITSVNNQNYNNIEHVIIDGGSSDNTIKIIRSIPNRVTKIVSEPDNGIYDAMNKGIKMASGEVIGILNSDDFYHSNSIVSKIVSTFNNDYIDALYGDVRFVSWKDSNKTVRYYSSKMFKPSMFRFGFMPAHASFFTYKIYFEKYGYYRTDFLIASDFELLLRFLYVHELRAKYLPVVFLKMRLGGVSTKSIKSNFIINKEIVKACKENGIYTNMGILMLKYFIKVWQFIFIKRKKLV